MKTEINNGALHPLILITLFGVCGCYNVNYAVKEKFGIHKRDILISTIESAKIKQNNASDQFQSALDSLMQIYQINAGELEQKYALFYKEFEESKSKAGALKDGIKRANRVAKDLFAEWEREITEIQSTSLRTKSRSKFQTTRVRFDSLISAFRFSEEKMGEVLVQLKDQVLYLKHNLNASSINSLEGKVNDLQNEMIELIKRIRLSINEADSFIGTLPE